MTSAGRAAAQRHRIHPPPPSPSLGWDWTRTTNCRDSTNTATKVTGMTPAAKIASDTWRRLSRAHHLGARLGEETLTDLLVLEMLHSQKSNAFRVVHPTRHDESRWGADLLVWIRRNNGLSRFLAIQAKKLYPDGNYKTLNYHVRPGVRQIDLLNAFALKYHAIPLYLLYNHFDSGMLADYWHCCKQFDIEQLGCTLVPSWKIEFAIRPHRRGRRRFTEIHATAPSRPWRCAFDCDLPERQLMALESDTVREPFTLIGSDVEPAESPVPYPEPLPIELPHSLLEMDEPLPTVALDRLRRQMDEQSGNDPRDETSSEQEGPLSTPNAHRRLRHHGRRDRSRTMKPDLRLTEETHTCDLARSVKGRLSSPLPRQLRPSAPVTLRQDTLEADAMRRETVGTATVASFETLSTGTCAGPRCRSGHSPRLRSPASATTGSPLSPGALRALRISGQSVPGLFPRRPTPCPTRLNGLTPSP